MHLRLNEILRQVGDVSPVFVVELVLTCARETESQLESCELHPNQCREPLFDNKKIG